MAGCLPSHTLFIKKDLLNEIGYYDESLKISSDYEFMIRLFRKDKLKFFFLTNLLLK